MKNLRFDQSNDTRQISKGVKFRFMFSEYWLPNFNHPGEAPYVEKRTLTDVPITIVCTEKEAGICFPSTEGRMDYAAFHSKDQMFINWARDLFLHYWDKGIPCHPTKAQFSETAQLGDSKGAFFSQRRV